MKRLTVIPDVLPCRPCPHSSVCCSWGTELSVEEARVLEAMHPNTVLQDVWGDMRTRVVNGRCVFRSDDGCSIHETEYYPSMCRGFPWRNALTNGPYEDDLTICPEMASTLIALQETGEKP